MTCDEPLFIKSIRRASCTRPEGHKGRHSVTLMDGTTLKWTNKKPPKPAWAMSLHDDFELEAQDD